MRPPIRFASGTWLASGSDSDIFGEVAGMMSVGAEVFCGIAGRLAEAYDVGRRSHVADFSRAFSHVTLIFVAREIREPGAGAKRAAR
jgi:hypothetical protein